VILGFEPGNVLMGYKRRNRVQDIIERFETIVDDPVEYLIRWKDRNKRRIIACVPMHFPEEILHAAGVLPVVTWESDEPFSIAHSYVPVFFCGVVRSIVDMALKDKLGFFDGIVFPDTCLQVRGIKNIIHWNYQCEFQDLLYLPPVLKRPSSAEFLRTGLHRFKKRVEAFIGGEIADDALRNSIEVYDRNRLLLRELYDLRRERPGLVNAKEVRAIVVSSMLMPKEEHSELLSDCLAVLRSGKSSDGAGVRLVLAGSLCEAPKVDLLNLLEEAGAVIVDDDIYTGSRYFARDAGGEEDPMEALAVYYEEMMARCPTRIDHQNDWGPYLVDMVKRSNAQGVVNLMVKYCEPHNLWYPDVKRHLEEAGIPEFLLETEHEIMSLGQIKTRLQAFIETIGGV
jgi:benzoyl-CoA reductase subunit C